MFTGMTVNQSISGSMLGNKVTNASLSFTGSAANTSTYGTMTLPSYPAKPMIPFQHHRTAEHSPARQQPDSAG